MQNSDIGQANHAPSYASTQPPQYHQPSASPAPIHHHHQYAQQASNSYTPPVDQHATPQNRYAPVQRAPASDTGYPRADEVFRLPENANLAIPEEVRKQFQQDEQGHVLFFTAPPLDTLPPVKPGSAVGHTAKYLAARLRTQIEAKEKRKAAGVPEDGVEAEKQIASKRTKRVDEDPDLAQKIITTREEALRLWTQQMRNGTDRMYQDLYGPHWEEGKHYEGELLRVKQAETRKAEEELRTSRQAREQARKVSLAPSTSFKDDWDPRY